MSCATKTETLDYPRVDYLDYGQKGITFYLVHLEWQRYGSCNFLHEMNTCIPMPSKWQCTRIYPYTKYNL